MTFGTAMQRTMTPSTSYQSSVAFVRPASQRSWAQTSQRNAGGSAPCSAYSRYQNCGPRYGPQRGFGFGPMTFGDGAMAAVQIAELMQSFAKSVNSQNTAEPSGFLPIDMEEQETKYVLTADIPGLEKADLKISINQAEQTLKIAGDRQRVNHSNATDEQNGRQKFKRQYERIMGKFQRTISNLPKDADLSSVSARVDKGVLTISILKKEPTRDEQDIRIDID